MTDRTHPKELIALLAAGLGLCCGLPVLASLGVLGAIAGWSVGSWVLILVGVAVASIGAWRWRHRASEAEVERTAVRSHTEATGGRSRSSDTPGRKPR